MKPKEFPQMTVKIAEEQEEYQTLPAYISPDGVVIACFELSEKEREQVSNNGEIYLSIHTSGQHLQPIGMSVLNPWGIENDDKVVSNINSPSYGYTVLGTRVPKGVKGILYICNFNKELLELTVTGEKLYMTSHAAIEDYSNIPNPESQLVTGKTYEGLSKNLQGLHKRMNMVEWLEALKESL